MRTARLFLFLISVAAFALSATFGVVAYRVIAGAPPNGALAVDCDAAAAGVQSACDYSIGATFDVQINVTAAPTGGYYGHQVKLGWDDPQLDYLPADSTSSENLWPNCGLAIRNDNQPAEPSMLFGCIPIPPLLTGKTATGAILQFAFTCQQAGVATLQLIPRLNDLQQGTHFLDNASNPIDPVLTSAAIECLAAPTPTPTPSPSPTPTPDIDADGDGCTNGQELGTNPAFGGQRDPYHFWDFFDTPETAAPRDRLISTGDLLRVVGRFGAVGDPAIDPLSDPPPAGYHTAFDRGAPAPGSDPWDNTEPDGAITISDILLVVIQFGHTCAASP